ncbi:DUF982 domain-containing protein (plasmid) [Mesorhizobium sp. AaZ16]|uniref:DUF982 domain-containing protein n=1 Tax=Mesorhizobium sp. AaZ16 TaxID=3402289 RepID=UPI00374F9DDA
MTSRSTRQCGCMDAAPARSATSAASGRPRNGCFTNGRRRSTQTVRAARKACLVVLEGQRKAAAARQAFREAAEEAGILIGDVDRVPPTNMKR